MSLDRTIVDDGSTLSYRLPLLKVEVGVSRLRLEHGRRVDDSKRYDTISSDPGETSATALQP